MMKKIEDNYHHHNCHKHETDDHHDNDEGNGDDVSRIIKVMFSFRI